jgi:hypothetical protein
MLQRNPAITDLYEITPRLGLSRKRRREGTGPLRSSKN